MVDEQRRCRARSCECISGEYHCRRGVGGPFLAGEVHLVGVDDARPVGAILLAQVLGPQEKVPGPVEPERR